MSVTIHWRPLNDKGKHFQGGTSSSLERLRRAFGTEILAHDDLPKLRAMAIAADDEFYNEIADIVESVGDITFWGEY